MQYKLLILLYYIALLKKSFCFMGILGTEAEIPGQFWRPTPALGTQVLGDRSPGVCELSQAA